MDTCKTFNEAEAMREAEYEKKSAAYKGVGHWFLSYRGREDFCFQMNGDKVGFDTVNKHFKEDTLT